MINRCVGIFNLYSQLFPWERGGIRKGRELEERERWSREGERQRGREGEEGWKKEEVGEGEEEGEREGAGDKLEKH